MPGRDGVGDYTRRLAGEVVRKGNEVSLVALNDPFVKGCLKEFQSQANITIPVLRLGRNIRTKNTVLKAKQWIDYFDPDWLSLQFVPFAFQIKGLPWLLGPHLKLISAGRNWHIMFHELWVGMSTTDSTKHKIYGLVQKQIIRHLIFCLKPKKIHTQTRLYQKYLTEGGQNPEYLSLFSNIEPSKKSCGKSNIERIEIAIFGALHSGAKLEEFIDWLESHRLEYYRFHFLGNNGSEASNWIEVLKKKKVEFKEYGWISEKEISNHLALCNLAITSTPFFLVEKSGSVAAMIGHNLKVLCIARDWQPRGVIINHAEIGVIQWSKQLRISDVYGAKTDIADSKPADVASKFLSDLVKN